MTSTVTSTATTSTRTSLRTHVRAWYCRTYPSDECGMEIDPHLTFSQLSHALAIGQDIYDTIGIGDSVIRERCFQELATIENMAYDDIYSIWMTGHAHIC